MFDSINHQEAALVGPYSYHPASPVSADIFKNALMQGYIVARNSARLIGYQTYNFDANDQAFFTENALNISASAVVGIARFEVQLPPHATQINYWAMIRVVNQDPCQISHRVYVTDGALTDTGTTSSSSFQTTPPEERSGIDPWKNDTQVIEGSVDINTVDVSGLCTVTIEARCAGNRDQTFRPCLAMAYWSCVG